MNHKYALGLLLTMSTLSPVSAVRAAEPPNILLSEIAWAGSAKSTADEWVELRNMGSGSVDISGWQLAGAGSGGSVLTIPSATLIPAGSTYLIANYTNSDEKSALAVQPNLVTTSVSIPNTGITLTLLDSTGAVVDSLTDPGTPDFGSSSTFSTMKRDTVSMGWFTESASSNVLSAVVAPDPEPSSPPIDVAPAAPDPTPPEIPVDTPDPIVTDVIATDVTDVIVTNPVASAPINNEVVVTVESVSPDIAPTPIDDLVSLEYPPLSIAMPDVPPLPETPPVPEETINEAASVVIDAVMHDTDDIPAPKSEPIVPSEPASANPTEIPESISVIEATIPAIPVLNSEPEVSIALSVPVVETSAIITSTIHVGDIVISEILPSPSTGYDEWIELRNTTQSPIPLDTLTITDASGSVTTLSGTIPAQGYFTIVNPSGNLNNNADSVTLLHGTDILDTLSYGTSDIAAPKKDFALAFVNNAWVVQVSTPGAANGHDSSLIPTISPTLYAETPALVAAEQATIVASSDQSVPSSGGSAARSNHVASSAQRVATSDPVVAPAARVKAASITPAGKIATTKTSTAKKKVTKQAASPRSVSQADIDTLTDATFITFDAVVVTTTGIIGKRSFFVDGLEIYQSTGTLADVQAGDHVRITGEVSVLSDHRRVNIREGGVVILGTATSIIHDYAETLPYGSLVRLTGTVSARDGNAILLKTNTTTVKITPGNGIVIAWANLAGATVTVTGILKHGSQETIVLRSENDILPSSIPESTADVAGTSTSLSSSKSSFPWGTAALIALASAAFGAWIWYTRPKARTSALTLQSQNV